MKRTLIVLSLVLVFCLAGLGTAFADDGTYHGDNSATISENGASVGYNTVYVTHDVTYSNNKNIQTKSIVVPEDVVEFVINKWHKDIDKNPTDYEELQVGVLNIIDDSSLLNKDYSDFYKVNKTYESEKLVTIEERDGLLWIVTKWTTHVDEFTFRMAGDSEGEGQSDLLLFLVNSYDLENEERAESNTLIHPIEEVKDIPLIEPREDPITSDEEAPSAISPEAAPELEFFDQPHVEARNSNYGSGSVLVGDVVVTAATMKKSGLPILPVLLVLLLTGMSAIGIRRRKN